jgi:TolB-like protein
VRLLQELNRRNVIRIAILYVAIAWLLIQIADVLSSLLNLPNWTGALVVTLLALGFFPVLIFSWIYEITPEGLKREKDVDRSAPITSQTAQKLNVIIVALLVIAIASVWIDRFLSQEAVNAVSSTGTDNDSPNISDKTIAVLPFVNMSEDPGNEYFADGISEEILNLLVRLPELQVTSRSSAFSFKEQNVDVPTIAARLNVAHVLEGSVRKSGDQLRITAQLIDVGTDTHLWSETYDRKLEDIFIIQDEIAAAVVSALKIQLLGDAPKKEKTDPKAYAMYLEAQQLLNHRSRESVIEAENLLHRVLDTDRNFAPAWVLLAVVYNEQTSYFRLHTPDEGLELGRNAVESALQADRRYGPAHTELAMINLDYEFDFDAARRHVKQALDLSPGDVRTLQVAAFLEVSVGNFDKAIGLGQRAVAIDPWSYWSHSMLGWIYYRAGRMADAEESYQVAVSRMPAGSPEPVWIIAARVVQGDVETALTLTESLPRAARVFALAIVQHALGNEEASDAALDELTEHYGEGAGYKVAAAHAYRGDFVAAFKWLERAFNSRDPMLAYVLTDPLLSRLHDDSRWEAFLAKLGLPH